VKVASSLALVSTSCSELPRTVGRMTRGQRGAKEDRERGKLTGKENAELVVVIDQLGFAIARSDLKLAPSGLRAVEGESARGEVGDGEGDGKLYDSQVVASKVDEAFVLEVSS